MGSEMCIRDSVATEEDVATAIELFSVSTLEAAKMGDLEMEGGARTGEEETCEMFIRTKIGIGQAMSKRKICAEMNDRGYPERAGLRAINALVKQGDLEQVSGGKMLKRHR